jgi:hypothetical protein
MQVFLPTARAPEDCGFSATRAFANPRTGRGRLLRSTVSSAERFVEGGDLKTSSRQGWDCPAANVHTSNPAPRLAVIHKLSAPRLTPPPCCSIARQKCVPHVRLIVSDRAECADLSLCLCTNKCGADSQTPIALSLRRPAHRLKGAITSHLKVIVSPAYAACD